MNNKKYGFLYFGISKTELLDNLLMAFELNGKEFIELNKLLKIMGLVESGGQANLFIAEGQVQVDGEVETAKRKKMRAGAVIHFMENEITVK